MSTAATPEPTETPTPRHRFAASVLAYKQLSGVVTVYHHAIVVESPSSPEAEGLALAIVRKVYPPSDGWQHYDVKVCPVGNVVNLEGACLMKEGS